VNQTETTRLGAYLSKLLGSPTVSVRHRKGEEGDVLVAGEPVAELIRDDDEGEVSYSISLALPVKAGAKKGAPMDDAERARLQGLLREKLHAVGVDVRARPRKTDSAEVYVGEEFIGTLSTDVDEGYFLTMSILEMDLEGEE
jgi:hypothetical protein